jgi:hypothetical protein
VEFLATRLPDQKNNIQLKIYVLSDNPCFSNRSTTWFASGHEPNQLVSHSDESDAHFSQGYAVNE